MRAQSLGGHAYNDVITYLIGQSCEVFGGWHCDGGVPSVVVKSNRRHQGGGRAMGCCVGWVSDREHLALLTPSNLSMGHKGMPCGRAQDGHMYSDPSTSRMPTLLSSLSDVAARMAVATAG